MEKLAGRCYSRGKLPSTSASYNSSFKLLDGTAIFKLLHMNVALKGKWNKEVAAAAAAWLGL